MKLNVAICFVVEVSDDVGETLDLESLTTFLPLDAMDLLDGDRSPLGAKFLFHETISVSPIE